MSRSRSSPATSICSIARSYRTLTARRIAPAEWKSSGRAYICGDGCSPSFLRPGAGLTRPCRVYRKKQAVCGVSQTHRSTPADPEPVSTGRPARNAHPPVTVNQAHKAARRSGGNQRGHHAPTALSSGPGEISPQWGVGGVRALEVTTSTQCRHSRDFSVQPTRLRNSNQSHGALAVFVERLRHRSPTRVLSFVKAFLSDKKKSRPAKFQKFENRERGGSNI